MNYLQQVYMEIGSFMTKEAKLLKIFRLLPLEQRNDVLSWVNNISTQQSQEYSSKIYCKESYD